MAKTIILAIFILTNTSPSKLNPNSQPHNLSRGNVVVKKVTFEAIATSYCLRGRTATGTKPRIGTVAVDPRIIPLGSRIYVEGYGWARAEDTGSAIKGKRIDVWLPSRSQALKWGVRKVKVTVFISQPQRQLERRR